jgi:hypothetical protein
MPSSHIERGRIALVAHAAAEIERRLAMSSEKNPTPIPARSPETKPGTPAIPDMLTPSEIESLRRAASGGIAFAQKAFAKDRG